MTKVLVTGATGFLGLHIVRKLVEVGHSVDVIVRYGSNLRNVDMSATIFYGDLTDKESIEAIIKESAPDVIINCAAYGVDSRQKDELMMYKVNLEGTMNLLVAADTYGVRKFIQAGSCFEFGDYNFDICDYHQVKPFSAYGLSKAGASMATVSYAENGLDAVVLRPFGMYGEGEGDHRLVPMLIKACIENRKVDLTKGEQVRDYSYVGDVADVFVEAVDMNFGIHRTFNVGSGVGISIRELGEKIQRMMGKKGLFNWGALEYRKDEPMWIVKDEESRFICKTKLEDGLKKTIEYYENKTRNEK